MLRLKGLILVLLTVPLAHNVQLLILCEQLVVVVGHVLHPPLAGVRVQVLEAEAGGHRLQPGEARRKLGGGEALGGGGRRGVGGGRRLRVADLGEVGKNHLKSKE